MGCNRSLEMKPPVVRTMSVDAPSLLTSEGGACDRKRRRLRSGGRVWRGNFQVWLGGEFKDYDPEEDAILKRAFVIGHPKVKFSFGGKPYEVSFKDMSLRNLATEKVRTLRAPRGVYPPPKPLLPPGPVTVIMVPADAQDTIEIEDPNNPGCTLAVLLPANWKPGMQLGVPLPEPGEAAEEAVKRHAEWRAGCGIAACGASAAETVVVGALLGEHLAGGLWVDGGDADSVDVLSDYGRRSTMHSCTTCPEIEAFVMNVF